VRFTTTPSTHHRLIMEEIKAGYHGRLDRTLLSVLSQLESFEECASVDVVPSEGCSSEIANWEKKNVPYVLPSDLKAFYSQFNGINVSYKVDIAGRHVTIGEMKLNKLDSITRVALEGTFPKMNWSRYGGSSGGGSNSNNSNGSAGGSSAESYVLDFNTSAAFTLDSSLEIGQVVLLYRSPDETGKGGEGKLRGNLVNPYEDPEIWFQDISARWHYISATFSNFLRLLLAHMGVFGWHMAYTPEGLSSETIHWMGLFCKERICVDLSAVHTSKSS
jgi:hypothetical protein